MLTSDIFKTSAFIDLGKGNIFIILIYIYLGCSIIYYGLIEVSWKCKYIWQLYTYISVSNFT